MDFFVVLERAGYAERVVVAVAMFLPLYKLVNDLA